MRYQSIGILVAQWDFAPEFVEEIQQDSRVDIHTAGFGRRQNQDVLSIQ